MVLFGKDVVRTFWKDNKVVVLLFVGSRKLSGTLPLVKLAAPLRIDHLLSEKVLSHLLSENITSFCRGECSPSLQFVGIVVSCIVGRRGELRRTLAQISVKYTLQHDRE